MPIEQSAGGFMITGESIPHYKLLLLIQGLKAELKGFRLTSKGRTCYSLLKSNYGLKGNRESVLAQSQDIMANIKKEYQNV